MSYLPWVIALGCVFALYPCWLAHRLRRLHTRVETAARALDTRLTCRARAVLETAQAWPPENFARAAELREAANRALTVSESEREAVQSELTKAIRAAIVDPTVASLTTAASFDEIVVQNRRAETARSLYNDAVRDTIGLRHQRLLRLLRLAAHLPAPKYFDFDTTLTANPPTMASPTPVTASPV